MNGYFSGMYDYLLKEIDKESRSKTRYGKPLRCRKCGAINRTLRNDGDGKICNVCYSKKGKQNDHV